MKIQCVTCGIESEDMKKYFELSGRTGLRYICKECAAEIGIHNFWSAGFHSNTKVLKKYVKIHPEAQGRLDQQLQLLDKWNDELKAEIAEMTKHSGCTKKKQFKCNCRSCGNIYYYGDYDVVKNTANVFRGSNYSINQFKDLAQCPKCGSRAIAKKEVYFWVDKKGNCVDVEE